MKKILLSILIFGATWANGQDLHFSQTAQTPVFINPASVGVFDGWERVVINHRNQWLGANTQFMTTAIAADVNFFKSEYQERAHLGLGLLFYNDIGGDSKFGNYTGAITVTGILPLGAKGHTLSIGVQAGAGQRKADISRLTFLSQWDGTSLNPLIDHGEANNLQSFLYLDASSGLFYQFDGGKSSFTRDSDFKLKIGAAGYHLNAPKLEYANGSADRLARKFVGHVEVIADLGARRLAIDASVVQFIQGGHYETILGAMLRYRFESATKITGHTQDAFIGFGAYMRVKDAIIPAVQIQWRGFNFGASYDVTISQLRKAHKGGSLEFSLGYTNLNHAIFKTKGRKY